MIFDLKQFHPHYGIFLNALFPPVMLHHDDTVSMWYDSWYTWSFGLYEFGYRWAVSRCFAALRQLHPIRHSVPASTFQTLVVALIHSRLDYSISVLVGLPAYVIRRLQSVHNAAARLIFHLRRSDHISDALICLHWLRVPKPVEFKIAMLTHKVLCGVAPRYLGPLNRVSDVSGWRCLRSSGTNRLVVPRFRLSTVTVECHWNFSL